MSMVDLGLRLKKIRIKKGVSRESLARSVKVSAETLRKIEGGLTKSPGAQLIFKLASKLNVAPEYLLFGDETRMEADNAVISQTQTSTLQIKLPEPFVVDDITRRELERRVIFELGLIRERHSQDNR